MVVMDNTAEIKRSLQTLLGIVVNLFRMAGFEGDSLIQPIGRGERSMPRKLYRAVMSILIPVEATTRRLIIAMAKGIKVPLPTPRLQTTPGADPVSLVPQNETVGSKPGDGEDRPTRRPEIRIPRFRLFDPPLPARRPQQPRTSILDDLPQRSTPPQSDKPIDAARLVRRLSALDHALVDMEAEAERYARWQAKQDARQQAGVRYIEPLRWNAPLPGGRLHDFDQYLRRASKKNIRDIDEVLVLADLYAEQAILFPDTS